MQESASLSSHSLADDADGFEIELHGGDEEHARRAGIAVRAEVRTDIGVVFIAERAQRT